MTKHFCRYTFVVIILNTYFNMVKALEHFLYFMSLSRKIMVINLQTWEALLEKVRNCRFGK